METKSHIGLSAYRCAAAMYLNLITDLWNFTEKDMFMSWENCADGPGMLPEESVFFSGV